MNNMPAVEKETAEVETRANERIVTEAIRLFYRKGFHATSVREIVEAAGVTKPVLYYYFKNKDDLLSFILVREMEEMFSRLSAICRDEEAEFEEMLTRIAECYFDHARNQPDLVRFFNSIAFSGLYEHVFDFLAHIEHTFELLFTVFQRAAERGELRTDINPRSMAIQFHGMLIFTINGIVYMPEHTKDKPLVKNVVGLILDGVLCHDE
jgi:AcrR family transcriptional regulator